MVDNYVQKRQYTGLKANTDGQVELSTEPVDESELVTSKPDEKEPRKNGGGAEKKTTTKE